MNQPGKIRKWILSHDDSKLFILLYLLLAVSLSVFLGLFWLLFIIIIHFILEIIKQSSLHEYFLTAVFQSFWELKLDIALFIFALSVGIYAEIAFGAAGIGPGARLIAQAGSRFAAWEYLLKIILLSADDVAQVVKGFQRFGRDRGKQIKETSLVKRQPLKIIWGSWSGNWKRGARITVAFGIFCLASIFISPLFTELTFTSLWTLIKEQLRP